MDLIYPGVPQAKVRLLEPGLFKWFEVIGPLSLLPRDRSALESPGQGHCQALYASDFEGISPLYLVLGHDPFLLKMCGWPGRVIYGV